MADECVVMMSSLSHPRCSLLSSIKQQRFSCAAELLLPFREPLKDTALLSRLSHEMQSILSGPYSLIRASPLLFVSEPFLSSVIRAPGEFMALSLGPCLYSTDIVGVTPQGLLEMTVHANTFHELGIPGTSSLEHPRKLYHVSVDLRAKSFRKGRKLHDRVVECLQEKTVEMEFVCVKAGPDGSLLPIIFPPPIPHRQVSHSIHTHHLHPFPVPSLYDAAATLQQRSSGMAVDNADVAADESTAGIAQSDWPLSLAALQNLQEWGGAASCGITMLQSRKGQKDSTEGWRVPVGYEWEEEKEEGEEEEEGTLLERGGGRNPRAPAVKGSTLLPKLDVVRKGEVHAMRMNGPLLPCQTDCETS